MMQVNIDSKQVAALLHKLETNNEIAGIADANHQLANVIEELDHFTDIDALKRFIVKYGLWVLDLGPNPLDAECGSCFGAPQDGTYCADCGQCNGA